MDKCYCWTAGGLEVPESPPVAFPVDPWLEADPPLVCPALVFP